MPKLWMGGVGTLCAIAHYRAALLESNVRLYVILHLTLKYIHYVLARTIGARL